MGRRRVGWGKKSWTKYIIWKNSIKIIENHLSFSPFQLLLFLLEPIKENPGPGLLEFIQLSTASLGIVSENEPLFCSWNFFSVFLILHVCVFFSIPWMTHWEPKGSQSKQTRQGSHPEGLSCSTFDLVLSWCPKENEEARRNWFWSILAWFTGRIKSYFKFSTTVRYCIIYWFQDVIATFPEVQNCRDMEVKI